MSDTCGKTDKGEQFGKDGVKCFYCKKKVYIVAECPVLQGRRNTKPVNLVSQWGKPSGASLGAVELAEFAPFIMDGYVSLEVQIKILRDTTASQSFILAGVLPLG